MDFNRCGLGDYNSYLRGGYSSNNCHRGQRIEMSSRHVPSMGGVYLMETLIDDVRKVKPVVVVSSEEFNKGPCCFIAPLTMEQKEPGAVIFKTWASGQESNAVVENLKKIDKTKLVEYVGQLSAVELQSSIDCICSLFGIDTLQLPESLKEPSIGVDPDTDKQISCLKTDLKTARKQVEDLRKEIEFYKQQYDSLLDKFLSRTR